MPTCATCKKQLDETAFWKDKRSSSGYRSSCKDCEKAKKQGRTKKASLPTPQEQLQVNTTENNKVMEGGVKYSFDDSFKGNYAIQTEYPEWNFDEKFEIGQHYAIAVVGSRKSGKTTFMKHMWPFFESRFDLIIFFTLSLQAKIYDFIMKSKKTIALEVFTPQVLDVLEKYQKATDNSLSIGIYFDDCSDKSFVKHSNDLLQLFIRGRNKNHTIFFSTQSPMFLDPDWRANTDFLLMLKCRTHEMKEKVTDIFLYGVVPTAPACETKSKKIEYLHQWIKVNTRKHRIMCIDFLNDNEEEGDSTDGVYTYKVPQVNADGSVPPYIPSGMKGMKRKREDKEQAEFEKQHPEKKAKVSVPTK